MTNLPSSLLNSRLLSPELIWLEPEQIEQAKAMSERLRLEAPRWQSYLNALALLGFEQWLSDRLPEQSIQRSPKPIESVYYVEVSGFHFCLIAVEHVLDETVRIPQAVVEQPELAAHFYVVHEVSEEQELVTVRGFCRYDELIRERHHYPIQDGYYQLPLAFLDAEPNHLLFYCRSLQPAAIALPISTSSPGKSFLTALTQTTTTLTQWLQGTFDESWQTIDQLINTEAYLSLSTRSMESGAKRGKLINLGVQLGQQAVALLVNVTSEEKGKLGVLVQLHPTGEAQYLIPDLKLSLRLQTGQTLQEVTARSQDNYIQLKPFKGSPGTRFSVAIHLDSEMVEENFEL
ncbi:MAG TPA: DUF1822 family protein [Chroococcales cyanobacterium]|jgi:hypothetical protein